MEAEETRMPKVELRYEKGNQQTTEELKNDKDKYNSRRQSSDIRQKDSLKPRRKPKKPGKPTNS